MSDLKKCDGVCDRCKFDFCVGSDKDSNKDLVNLEEDEIFDPYYFSYGMHW